jgi:predicted dehydrogenase
VPDLLDAEPEAGSAGPGPPNVQRVCIAGAGFARRYASAFAASARADVVGVCTRTHESAARVVSAVGGTAYTDFEEMLRVEQPDIVVVATPNHLHHPMTMSALRSGANVICEKPLGLDTAQAEEMTAHAASMNRRTATSFTWRFLPACIALKALLDERRLGGIYRAGLRYQTRGFGEVHGPMRWQFDRSAAGSGVLANLGSHACDLLHWWLGPVARVAATSRNVIPTRVDANGEVVAVTVEDVNAVSLELADGAPVSLSLDWISHVARVALEVEIHGSEASAWLRYATGEAPRGMLSVCDETMSAPAEVEIPADRNDWSDLGQACVTRLVAAFLGEDDNVAAVPDFTDGLRAQSLVDAVHSAATARRWADVHYPTIAAATGTAA